jgi:predicted ATPase
MIWIDSLEIHGYRGFAKPGTVHFAIPNETRGSGLTVIVGPNNAGKSTVVESLQAISRPSRQPPSFNEDKRNMLAGDRVSLILRNSEGETKKLVSLPQGGSETRLYSEHIEPKQSRIFVLPSRRTFNPYFGKGLYKREQWINSFELPATRGRNLNFQYRLFEIQENREDFNNVLKRILDPLPEWYIEQSGNGQYYLKFRTGDNSHNSDGMGEGLVSLFFIVDSLYDSKEGDIIAIDEPELSLHPHYQKRLREVFCDFSKNRQIILATHSPHFIDWEAIASGAAIIRARQRDNSSIICELSRETKKEIKKLLGDLNNPHVLGLEASEVFFLEDKVILVEGQEDVVFFPKILNGIGIKLPGTFFGWGVGGANKMQIIALMLHELGFDSVVGILDKNKSDLKPQLEKSFPNFVFEVIPADDVRSKSKRGTQPEVLGLVDEDGSLREVFKEKTIEIFNRIREALA